MNLFYKITLLLLMLMPFMVSAQTSDNFLPNTVVFKIKETHRNVCFNNHINITEFEKIAAFLKVNAVSKIFPHHQPEDNPSLVDLSLIYQLSYNNQIPVDEAIRMLKKTKLVEYAEPYYLPQLTFTPNDTLVAQQYYLGLIDAFNAWNSTQGDSNIVIGITDTGWDPAHPDLAGNVKINYADPINGIDDDNDGFIDNYYGWDLGMNDNNALFESTSHGVQITGIAAANTNNTTGIASVGFKTKFLPIKISNAAGILTHAYQGIVYAADHGCFIINCSWGGYNSSQFHQEIIDYATINNGCIVIAAAGNNTQEDIFYPAGYNGVLSVAATDQNDIKKGNSNFGTYIDVSAPGEAILTTTAGNGYGTNSGTSMSAPIVSGGAALVKSQFPSYTNQQVTAQLKATADDISALNPAFIDKLGTGRLNLFNAVTNTSAQFIDITYKIITDNNNEIFIAGDTLQITTTLTNFLATISGINVTLTSTSPYVNIINNVASFPSFNMLDTASNYTSPFSIEILSGASLNEAVILKATISNGTFSYYHYFSITLNPDFINMEVNQISTTITSKGKIGYNNFSNSIGLGFKYQGKQLLYEAGLMIGDNSTRVSDVIRDGLGQDQDFGSVANVSFNPPYVAALDLVGITDDLPSLNPLDIWIKQSSYAYSTAPNDKYIIVVYKIKNQGNSALNNVSVGLFADWDIENANANKANVDAARKMGFVHSVNSDSIYAAIRLLTSQPMVNYALDINGGGGGVDLSNGFTTAEKYTTLSTNRTSAGGFLGDDVAHVVSAGSFNLNVGEEQIVAFALIAGDSLLDIQQSADAAQNQFLNDALSIEEMTHSTFSVFPNPVVSQLTLNAGIILNNTQLIIKDITGKTILAKKIPDNSSSYSVNVDFLSSGIYFLEVFSNNIYYPTKFVKK